MIEAAGPVDYLLFMMAARQCCPVTTGGRDGLDILTLSFFCPLQQTWQEKEGGITAETGKFPPLLPPCPLFLLLPPPPPPPLCSFLLLTHATTCSHPLENTRRNSFVCCHIQVPRGKNDERLQWHPVFEYLFGTGNVVSEGILIHSVAAAPHNSTHPI